MSGPVACVGVDPGASAGVACVGMVPGRAPLLLSASNVHGSTRQRWHGRAVAAMDEAVACGARWLRTQGIDEPELVGLVELPPFTKTNTRRGSLAGDSQGMRSWHGMGIYSGWLRCLALERGVELADVTVSDWAHQARVRSAKVRLRSGPAVDGWHRLAEAGRVLGADERLNRMAEQATTTAALERCVCLAEAVLIATAGCLQHHGQESRDLMRERAAGRRA